MSKWVSKEKFEQLKEEKKQEKTGSDFENNRFPTKKFWGTEENPEVYKLRFLPDKNGEFYLPYHYHMVNAGDKWYFFLCEKTYGMEKFCPFCSISAKLYSSGNEDDKKLASKYRRMLKFMANVLVVDDPRDAKRDDDSKINGKVMIYEFPKVVESKLKNEITNEDEGFGIDIFDPGKNGHDFILTVGSKYEPKKNATYPQYGNSMFSRKSNPIADSDKEISEIMENVYDLSYEIQKNLKDHDDVINFLKSEMIFDLVENDCKKYWKIKKEVSETEEEAKENLEEIIDEDFDDSKDMSDEDILNLVKNT